MTLHAMDLALFALVNQRWSSPLLDAVMPTLTDLNRRPAFWAVLGTAAAAYLWRRRAVAGRALAAAALAVGLADASSARVLKPLFRRPRPAAASAAAVLRTPPAGGWSFPSSHAANTAAAAAAFALADPPLALLAVPVAAAVAYSRVYVGAHYPADVAGGALWGAFAGWLAARAMIARRFVLAVQEDA